MGEITDWIINNLADSTPRVFWLHGQAGKGKSSIAHTIANHLQKADILGSCFCFSRDSQVERRHEKIFATIARDLANRNPALKNIIARVVSYDNALATTADVKQQWEKLILKPLSELSDSMIKPVVIVIDALDESGDQASRKHILDILSSQAMGLPFGFRIFITSRPLPDIVTALQGLSHVISKSMDDISVTSVEQDIRLYFSDKLGGSMDHFSTEEISCLVRSADGLFEWARLACEYMNSHKGGLTHMERYQTLISVESGEGEGPLDKMYLAVLRDVIEDDPRALARFCSVMQQILWSQVPLSVESLEIMRCEFNKDSDDVKIIVGSMGALLSGITDMSTPVRALHASFYEFLADSTRSKEFAVTKGDVHSQLARACVYIMQAKLCFNICQLETSYLPNSEVADLDWRVKNYIPECLSYACQFWVVHLQEISVERDLGQEVELLLKDKLLFWIETLSLLKVLNVAPSYLEAIASWLDLEVCKLTQVD